MPFADASDRRVAGHLREQIGMKGKKRRLRSHSRSRHRSLASGMPPSNDNDIKFFTQISLIPFLPGN
jgi:hypothetical protein